MDILTYALAKNYTDKALLGVGTIKGAPCTVKSQTEDDEYVYVTLGWESSLGTSEETVVKIKKGADGAPGEPGPAGDPGPQGVSITKIEKIKTEGLIDTYQISFSDNTTFEYTVSNGSDAVIDDNETGLAKTFSSDKITKTFATLEEVNKRIPQHYVLPTPTEACNGQVVQFIGITTGDYVHNYFYECVQVEGSYRWVNIVVQNVPTKVSELTNDSNFVTETELNEKGYLTEHQDISGKVDKEEGKSLIADSEITRLSTVKNYDDSVVKEDIATIKTDYATKTYVGEQIAAADHLKREIVTEIPTVETAAENVIYMLKVESTVGADKYKEYMLIDGEVACVGDTSVDLTDYAKKDEIPTELPANGGNADTAASVPWSGITKKPSSYTPSSHKHAKAEITDFPSSMPASDVPAWAKESTKPSYTKAEVGLENVDNTADANKPVSTAQKEEFDKINSGLTALKTSDFAGGKNLVLNTVYGFIAVDKKVNIDNSSTSYIFYAQAGKTYSFSGDATPTAQGVRFAKVSSISPETQEAVSDFNLIEDGVSTFTTNETGYYMLYVYNTKTSGIKFQIEEGTTATEYEPHIPSVKMLADTLTADVASVRKDVDEIEETVSDVRKEITVNLLNPTLETTASNGVTLTANGDGTYTLNGTATSKVALSLGKVSLKANKSYKLIAQSPADTGTDIRVHDKRGVFFGDGTYKGATPIITPTADAASIVMLIEIAKTTTLNNFIVKPMITTNLDATYDDFVPYTGDTGKLNSDVANIKKDIIDPTIYQGVDLTVKFANEIKNYSDEWAWIKARKTAGNYAGLHVGDYIPITCSNGYVLKAQIAGMNTYTGYADQEVGNHIDFICKELWNDPHVMNKIDYNNGNANSPNPFLASDLNYWLNSMSGTVPNSKTDPATTVEVDYTAGGVLYYLPDKLKNQIITKRVLLPSRYTAGSVLTQDNSWAWQSTGKLWIPSEVEVYGMTCWGNSGYGASGFVQYPIFIGNMNRAKKRCSNKDRSAWWLLSAYAGGSAHFAYVSGDGACNAYSATRAGIAAPVCFRI